MFTVLRKLVEAARVEGAGAFNVFGESNSNQSSLGHSIVVLQPGSHSENCVYLHVSSRIVLGERQLLVYL